MRDRQGYAFSVRRTEAYCVVEAQDELDVASTAELRAVVRGAGRRAGRIVVDLRRVTFMDSYAVRTLVALQAETGEGSHFHVVPGDRVQRVLDVTGARDELHWISAEQLAH